MDIRVEEISFRYSDSRVAPLVLDNVSFTLQSGECVALVGPSGSGKSTLAQLLNGLLSPTSGRLHFGGKSPSDGSINLREVRRKVSLVFQFPEAQIFALTVFEEVAYAARQQGKPEKEITHLVNEALLAVGLEPTTFVNRQALKLSGGEARLITIASLLVVDPDWLILDEPTLGLDYPHFLLVKSLIEKRRKLGQGVLLITHDLDLVSEVAPRTLALQHGRLVWDGSTQEFLLAHDLPGEFGLTDPESVGLWKCLKSELPELELPKPSVLETWANELPDEMKIQVMAVLRRAIVSSIGGPPGYNSI